LCLTGSGTGAICSLSWLDILLLLGFPTCQRNQRLKPRDNNHLHVERKLLGYTGTQPGKRQSQGSNDGGLQQTLDRKPLALGHGENGYDEAVRKDEFIEPAVPEKAADRFDGLADDPAGVGPVVEDNES